MVFSIYVRLFIIKYFEVWRSISELKENLLYGSAMLIPDQETL